MEAGAQNVARQPAALMRAVPTTGASMGPSIPIAAVTDSTDRLSLPVKQSLIRANAEVSAPPPPIAWTILSAMNIHTFWVKQLAMLDAA